MASSDDSTSLQLCNTQNALNAIRRGYQPIPLVTGTKQSRVPGWQKLRWENTPEGLAEAEEKFNAWAKEGHGGIGVLAGEPSRDLVDIDLDDPLTRRLANHFLPRTSARSGRDSRPSTHYWYHAKPGTLQRTRTFKLPDGEMIVEYRSTGAQTAIPDNIHNTGERYLWSGEPWGGARGPTEVDGRALLVQTALLGFCTLLVNFWPKRGGRHEAYLALAGGLLRVGDGVHPYWERNIGVVISAIVDATHDEDGVESRVTEVLESTIERLREGKPASGFGKLSEIIGEDAVKQARVLLAEIESAAGLPSRSSGSISLEQLDEVVKGKQRERQAENTAPATHNERRERLGAGSGTNTQDEEETLSNDPLENRLGTWEALDIDPYLTGQVQTVDPTVLEREDGQALLYPGRLNMLYGPSEAAKSWLSMFTCVQLIQRGERVLYLDFEDEPVNALERMQLLGASYDDLRTSFKYVRPEEPIADMQRNKWGGERKTEKGELNQKLFNALLDAHDPSLIVADGMTVLYGLHGLDSNDSVQTDIITTWLKKLTRNGRSTVIIVDHTAKDPQRGSYPIGSQHKVSMVQGTLLQTYPVRQPMRGDVGEVELIVLKDRPGKVRAASEKSGEKAQLAARMVMDSRVEGQTKITLQTPDTVSSAKPKTSPEATQQEVHLQHQRAAERAEQIDAENRRVLDMFSGDLEVELSRAEITQELFDLDDASDASTAQKKFVTKVLKRLKDGGWLMVIGDRRNSTYVLSAVGN